MTYLAPLKEMNFVLRQLVGVGTVSHTPGFEEGSEELAEAVLSESARLCQEVVSPLNHFIDVNPGTFCEGSVHVTPELKAAYRQYVNGGWQGISHSPEYGGQGLPKAVGAACMEMLQSASLAFSLCPLLTDGTIEAITAAASEELKQKYLGPLISGEWTGTMNLTEPQAGSDLSLLRTKAVATQEGTYLISGTKIFITWGEHDLTENIIHLVLARTPDAPKGVKGISLFVVPKFLPARNGTLGQRNSVECISVEHKLGIKASPTAVLEYSAATGYLVGEENHGLEYMFVMMNAARFSVGLQGIGVCERAYQKALGYARERVQGRPVEGSFLEAAPIIQHPDVRRMLTEMRALTEGARALAYVAAGYADVSSRSADETLRGHHKALYEFLVPIIKGWCTEISVEVASTGIQIHGGTGYIEETGAAQYFRDARILPIYEGTTAIQANDLIGRKLVRDGGAVARTLLGLINETLEVLSKAEVASHPIVSAMRQNLQLGRDTFDDATTFILDQASQRPNAVYGSAVSYLKLCGLVLCGWQMARSLIIALEMQSSDSEFYSSKLTTAHFYATQLLPRAVGYASAIQAPEAIEGALALDISQY
ncbi:acyl-CoA dehydrogenase [Stenotrophomonas maltophilia]|uniref:acyl-CoA dehydrogenase n=1 Tax=Stenotrophomonas maltophilia TaxID=40324 RepID=UPI003BF84F47